MPRIYVFIHITTNGHWRSVLKKILKTIRKNKSFYNIISKIKLVILGEYNRDDDVFKDPKIEIIFNSLDLSIYERATLYQMHELSQKEKFLALYMHTKGIRHDPENKKITDWVNYLLHFCVNESFQCIKLLNKKKYDAVGVNLRNRPEMHFSGNFWWANSKYIKKLPSKIEPNYLAPEMWINKAPKYKFMCLWESDIRHYDHRYKPEKYVGKSFLNKEMRK
jgi:hypothetical protein